MLDPESAHRSVELKDNSQANEHFTRYEELLSRGDGVITAEDFRGYPHALGEGILGVLYIHFQELLHGLVWKPGQKEAESSSGLSPSSSLASQGGSLHQDRSAVLWLLGAWATRRPNSSDRTAPCLHQLPVLGQVIEFSRSLSFPIYKTKTTVTAA